MRQKLFLNATILFTNKMNGLSHYDIIAEIDGFHKGSSFNNE